MCRKKYKKRAGDILDGIMVMLLRRKCECYKPKQDLLKDSEDGFYSEF
jgi:hypothetical protein